MERVGKHICENTWYITSSFDTMVEHKDLLNVYLKNILYQ